MVHSSVGDALRQATKDGVFNNDEEALARIARGELLSTEQILPFLRSHIEGIAESGAETLLLDGFPRSREQAVAFEKSVCMLSSCRTQHSQNDRSGPSTLSCALLATRTSRRSGFWEETCQTGPLRRRRNSIDVLLSSRRTSSALASISSRRADTCL